MDATVQGGSAVWLARPANRVTAPEGGASLSAPVIHPLVVKRAVVAARRTLIPWLHRVAPTHHTDADPFATVTLHARRITHMQQRWSGPIDLPWLETGALGRHASLMRRWRAGTVLAGDWDRATLAFERYHLTAVLRARFIDGVAWEVIPYVAKALRKVEAGQRAWGGRCRTVADVEERCRYLDALHASLARDGFTDDPSNRPADFTPVIVNVGRDGTIIRNNDGKHRVIIARLLDVQRLTVRVFVRHRRWQALRDAIRRGTAPPLGATLASHPDLQDLLTRR